VLEAVLDGAEVAANRADVADRGVGARDQRLSGGHDARAVAGGGGEVRDVLVPRSVARGRDLRVGERHSEEVARVGADLEVGTRARTGRDDVVRRRGQVGREVRAGLGRVADHGDLDAEVGEVDGHGPVGADGGSKGDLLGQDAVGQGDLAAGLGRDGVRRGRLGARDVDRRHGRVRGRVERGADHEGVGRGAILVDGERPGQQALAVERGGLGDPVDLGPEGRDLGCHRLGVFRAQRAVGRLDRQLANALEHCVDFVEGAFSRLDHRNAVLCIPLGLIEAGDLGLQLLADGQAGRVVRCPVDTQTARQLLHALGEHESCRAEVALGV
jgi:hypothetical protein